MKGVKLTKDFVSYGHYRLTVEKDGEIHSVVTGNTELITNLNSQFEEEKEQAEKEAIEFVLASIKK